MKNKEILGLRGAYASIYSNLSESHFKVGDEVICKNSGMEGEVVKVDSEEKGKYYTVKREDGKMVKYAPDELKLESEEKEEDEKDNGEEMKEEIEINEDAGIVSGLVGLALGAKGAYHAAKKTKRMRDYPKNFVKGIADPRTYVPQKKKEQKEEFDIFDVILEHLVAEGYADTNEAALAIMANMSEEWKHSILEESKRTEYLQKKFNKENERKSGSAHTYIPGKQSTGQALQKSRESERHMRGER
jgi:hypothetical protein